ncbi:MAG: Hpt domain-containing protein [Kiritimatiellae bacterium]|nr:Hpt domain-containing protein [Kiritimatiellia bacterium]
MKECCKKYLDEQFGGDADLVSEIYNEYVSSIGVKIGEAESALAATDWTKLDRTAHTIKGNALAAGDQEMADTAIALRKAAALADVALSASLLEKIKELSKVL